MPTGLIDAALPGGSKLPTAPSAVPARSASEDAGQRSRAIIPGDDPGDQQPPINDHITTTNTAVK
jgi:hypothetical protein